MLKPGTNCWTVGTARQASFLIDAASYYESLWHNLQRAERCVFILGWDFDSRLRLVPDGDQNDQSCPDLATLLKRLVHKRPELRIYLLLWDFSNIYLLGREAFQSIKLGLAMDPQIHFHFDDQHPVSASHHQKVVVIDDELAYSGGIDITGNRWDTSRHLPNDPARVNPDRSSYAPFHDVQMAVTGEPARALGILCRERWFRATGQTLPEPPARAPRDFDLGSETLRDARVAIARTLPTFKSYPEVREVERLFADMIVAAKRYIYIENQYFTSDFVCDKLATSLKRPIGPEIVMILPKHHDTWLAKVTMGTLSMRCLANLLNADTHGRFRVYYPEDTRLEGDRYINVHSKVMIVDDRYVRVGSANLNNRSMGLDTECDLMLDATERSDLKAGARRFLCRLLADHTGQSPDRAEEALADQVTLREAISLLNTRSHKYLADYVCPNNISRIESMLGELEVVDLDQTVAFEQDLDEFIYGKAGNQRIRLPERVPAGLFLSFVLCLTLAVVFAVSSILDEARALASEWIGYTPRDVVETGIFVVLAMVVGLLAFLPYNLMIVAVASAFPVRYALAYVLIGGLAGAVVAYALGRVIGRPLLHRAFALYVPIVRKAAARPSAFSVFILRFFPVAPFTVMSLLSGALRVRSGPYLLGTLLGILPGSISLVLFQRSLMALIRNPGFGTFLLFSIVTLLTIQVFSFLSQRFGNPPVRERYA